MLEYLENYNQKYLDRWGDIDWKEAGDRAARTLIKTLNKWGFRPKKILDIGCMNGYIMDSFIDLGYDVCGLEPSDLYKLSKYPERIFNIPLHEIKDKKFDFVFCSEVMEHIPEELVLPSLQALRDVLDGVAFFTISDDKDVDPTHITIHDRAWWVDRFSEAGFTYHPDKKTMKGFNFYCLT